ncbi:protein SSUH2 homolog [Paramormyrops kingsleyae]|uniref:Ssu-2 homolog, related sequence 1 n=1 Tax=Paramormyrops kingsleyae TaxID=1676925 RepID=A0A3B3SB29_9TELE|nr:protein SSUH2 homolog [Paramormyrops kingsleyae]
MYGLQAQPNMYPPPTANFQGLASPPMGFASIPGYDGVGGGGFLPPPPIPANPFPQPEPHNVDCCVPPLTEEAARSALKEYVSGHCCYGSDPVNDGKITEMKAFNTYRYRLETFTESRSTEWSQEPYTGQSVDAHIQMAPTPWNIPAQPPEMFKDTTKDIKVPNTSSLKDCDTCHANGTIKCTICEGSGKRHLGVSSSDGDNSVAESTCLDCSGKGTQECKTCKGKGKLVVYINLKVKWTNNKSDYTMEQSSGLKSDTISTVSGKKLLEDTKLLVYPVMGFPDAQLNHESERLVREHQAQYSQTARILQQRQTIEYIPISKVTYTWKERPLSYIVYGNEHKVYTNDYPATCCCTIL